MGSDLIRVTKPAWVRIVNPEPFSILDTTYRYGDVLLTKAGGAFRVMSDARPRALASYRAPHAPHDPLDCPTDALVYATLDDLRLTAEGEIGYQTPLDPELETDGRAADEPPCLIPEGRQARVPVSRAARVHLPPVRSEARVGAGAYRTADVSWASIRRPGLQMLRPHGVLTALEHRGAHVRVRYAAAAFNGAQCPEGAWWWMAAMEFISMELRYQELRRLEARERHDILVAMRSL